MLVSTSSEPSVWDTEQRKIKKLRNCVTIAGYPNVTNNVMLINMNTSCLGRDNSNLVDASIWLACRQVCQAFSWFVIGVCVGGHYTVAGAIPLWLVLGEIRK